MTPKPRLHFRSESDSLEHDNDERPHASFPHLACSGTVDCWSPLYADSVRNAWPLLLPSSYGLPVPAVLSLISFVPKTLTYLVAADSHPPLRDTWVHSLLCESLEIRSDLVSSAKIRAINRPGLRAPLHVSQAIGG